MIKKNFEIFNLSFLTKNHFFCGYANGKNSFIHFQFIGFSYAPKVIQLKATRKKDFGIAVSWVTFACFK